MNRIVYFILTSLFFCSNFSLHPFLKGVRISREAMNTLISHKQMLNGMKNSSEKLTDVAEAVLDCKASVAKAACDYKESVVTRFYQVKEINHAFKTALSQNVGKTAFGSMLFGGFVTANFLNQEDNQYAPEIREELLKAAEADNVQLVVTFDSILREKNVVQEAALKHALINSEKLPEKRRSHHLKTFEALLHRSEPSANLIANVIQGGDIGKVSLMLEAGASATEMLPKAIKAKNVEATTAILLFDDQSLSQDDAFVKAKILCDKNLLRRLFFDNRLALFFKKTKSVQNPMHVWLHKIKKSDTVIPEPVLL